MKTATFWSTRGGTKKRVAEVVIENDSPVTLVPLGMFTGTATFTAAPAYLSAAAARSAAVRIAKGELDAKSVPNANTKPKPQPLARGRILDIDIE